MNPTDPEIPNQNQWLPSEETKESLFYRYRLFILIGISIGVLLLLVISFITFNSLIANQSVPIPTPTPIVNNTSSVTSKGLTPLSKTTIGKTTAGEIESQSTVLKKEDLPNGGKKYTVKSANPVFPDDIITENDVVIFEATSTQTLKNGGFPLISTYLKTYGEPERLIKGNTRLNMVTLSSYLYPSKGFVIIANPTTKRVFEIQRFTPMTIDEYLNKYGDYVEGMKYERH